MKKIILSTLGIIFILIAFYAPTLPNYNFFISLIFISLAITSFYLANKPINFPKNINLDDIYGNDIFYTPKNFLSQYEYNFYLKMLAIQDLGYIIVPQVNLASIIEKHNSRYHNDLFWNIDFGIFDKKFKLLLLIELNDSSHQKNDRRDRDLKVKKILADCHINLITFYTYYPNEKDYVVKRILDNINNEAS